MRKLIYLDSAERRPHEEAWGSGMTLPKNWKEIGEGQFANRFFCAAFDKIEDRWVDLVEGGPPVQAKLFFAFDEDNVAVVKTRGPGLRYFEFGCHHDMAFIQNLGRCYNRYRCTKCGRTTDIDSSD